MYWCGDIVNIVRIREKGKSGDDQSTFASTTTTPLTPMAGIPPNKYDLLPYATTFATPPVTHQPLNYTLHRPSKREYIESSDVEDVTSSPPRKVHRSRKRREWRDSSDLGYSSDVDDEDLRRTFLRPDQTHRRRTITLAGGER